MPADPPPARAAAVSRRRWIKYAGAACGVGAAAAALDEGFVRLWPPAVDVDPNASYWSRALSGALPALDRSIDADVAVIGGGLTGLSAATWIRRLLPARAVVLLEARRCGNGASARNGGMLLPTTADRYLRPGPDAGLDRRIHDLTVENFDALRAMCSAVGVDAQFDMTGAATVLRSEAEVQALGAAAARMRAAGIAVETWDRERTATALGTAAYAGAAFVPQAGQLHPGRLVAAWRRTAIDAGVAIYEQTAVARVATGRVHAIETSGGAIVRAPVLVLATNGYGAQLGWLRRAVLPVWNYVGITPALSTAQLAALGWRGRTPYWDTGTELYYLGLSQDGRVRIGGGPVDYGFNGALPDASIAAARIDALQSTLWRLYPALRDLRFEAAWSGLVDMTLDESPALGRTGEHGNVYYAIGYSGHGVNLTSVFGRILAGLAAGEQARWDWLPYLNRLPPALPNEPLRWLAVKSALAIGRTFGW